MGPNPNPNPSPLPRIGALLPRDLPATQLLPYARLAESLGFAELWVVEDLGFRGGVAQAAAVLGATSTIEVGIGILPAGARNEAFAAMELATLAQLHPGRLIVGIGHGMPDWLRRVGAWSARPLHRLATTTTTIRDLLHGRSVTHVERSGDHELWALEPSAIPEIPPPVVLGVRGPRSLALAGSIADGVVLAEPVTPEYVHFAREAAGRPALSSSSSANWRVAGYLPTAIDDDETAALATVRPGLAWVGEADWQAHLAPLSFAADLAALRAEVGQAELAQALAPEWVRELALVGRPERARDRLRDLAAAGLTTAVLAPIGPDPLAGLAAGARILEG